MASKKDTFAKRRPPDSVIYTNGHIYTVDPASDADWSRRPRRAMAVEQGVIRFVGEEGEARERFRRSGTVMVDLRGNTVLPGFHDIHLHALEAGSEVNGTCQLPEGLPPDSREVARAVREGIKKQKGTEWVLGYGFSLLPMLTYIQRTRMANSPKDPKSILDRLVVDQKTHKPLPCIMLEENSHVAWVNSEALRRGGLLGSDSPSVPAATRGGGVVMKNQYGEPNGILIENAMNRLLDQALDSSRYPTLPQFERDGLLWSLRQLSKAGITSCCESPCDWRRGQHRVWERVEQEGRLTCRTILGMRFDPSSDDDRSQVRDLRRLFSNDPRSMLRRSLLHLPTDGVIISTTAAVLEPYDIDYNVTRDGENRGMSFLSDLVPSSSTGSKHLSSSSNSQSTLASSTNSRQSKASSSSLNSSPSLSPSHGGGGGGGAVETRLSRVIRSLQFVDKFGNGYDVDLRANGDRAVREALEALERIRPEYEGRRRHRITGMELVHREDIDRVRQANVIANLQLSSDWGLPSENIFEDLVNLVGARKSANAIPVRDLHLSGARVTLSSDWDVNAKSPLIGIRNALTRGRQAVDVQTAVEMYTINGAYAMRQEERVGSLVEGKEADFVVLDKNIIKLGHGKKPDEIGSAKVLMTVVGGKEAFRSPEFS